ncbi:hypothetical protein [Methylomonas koyamae]|uniref:hypothetical protein n=1 Tax=Methylomonas koyamae TaxID=702114 RepID=UPI001581FD5F|nr:hypothetical protein [Methylomonas koyamae]
MNPLFSGAKLGAGNGPGIGWNDMTIYKFGGQWRQNDRWVWSGGFSYGQQPIEGSEVLFNILASGMAGHVAMQRKLLPQQHRISIACSVSSRNV